MQVNAPDQSRIATSIERSFSSLKSSVAFLGRSTLGRSDMIQPDRILSDIKAVRSAIDKLEADCEAFDAERNSERAAAKAIARRANRQLQTYLDRHPDEIERARKLGIMVIVPKHPFAAIEAGTTKRPVLAPAR